jgi:hypothetical protein
VSSPSRHSFARKAYHWRQNCAEVSWNARWRQLIESLGC